MVIFKNDNAADNWENSITKQQQQQLEEKLRILQATLLHERTFRIKVWHISLCVYTYTHTRIQIRMKASRHAKDWEHFTEWTHVLH